MSKAALIQAGVQTTTGLFRKAPCAAKQWISVTMYDTDHGTYALDNHFPTLGDAEKAAKGQGADWIFTALQDAESWINKETGRD